MFLNKISFSYLGKHMSIFTENLDNLKKLIEEDADGTKTFASIEQNIVFTGNLNKRFDELLTDAENNPDNPEQWNRLGSFAYQKGKYPKALLYFHRAIKQAPNNYDY